MKKERVDLMVAKAVEKILEKEILEERQLKNQTFEALNKGFQKVIWRLRCEAIAEFEDSSSTKERKRKKIPETSNENEEEEIERSKKRQKTKESNKKNDVALETKQRKFSKIYCEVKEIMHKRIASFIRPIWL
ncbi:2434_t:CDS:2 [Gigaspora margarita]|uniref:2434_t:CDS:1 n=1 Tax=Gigaspora margarita TaxID=4874 RepID=A0ABN7VAJ6_GIGMA|nr:2434_t:CDS:2 [Gigaspora margarita]